MSECILCERYNNNEDDNVCNVCLALQSSHPDKFKRVNLLRSMNSRARYHERIRKMLEGWKR